MKLLTIVLCPEAFKPGLTSTEPVSDSFGQSLLEPLLQFYVDVENTGEHGQFYQKFNVRYEINRLFTKLPSLKALHSSSPTRFNLFVNMILNDSIWLLDEIMIALPKMKVLEQSSPPTSAQEKREREEEYAELKRKVQSCCLLGTASLEEMRELSVFIRMDEAMQIRTATMLNYFLWCLAGPQRNNLAVSNMRQIGFVPSVLLTSLIHIYIHLCRTTDMDFVKYITAEERSFNVSLFKTASQIVEKHALVDSETMRAWLGVVKHVESCFSERQEQDLDLSNCPEEFLDAIMSTLMLDPVQLPSKYVYVVTR